MCGRYTLRTKLNLLLSQFAAELAEGTEWEPRYNIPPTSNVPAVRLADGKRQLALFKWGLIPSWAKDAKIAYSTINARSDTVATKPAFRSAFKKRRCLVLADGYFSRKNLGHPRRDLTRSHPPGSLSGRCHAPRPGCRTGWRCSRGRSPHPKGLHPSQQCATSECPPPSRTPC